MVPERIVCLAAEIPDILHRLGALDRVVGISAYTKFPEEALHLPKISGFQTGSIDKIQSMNPDLAILTSNVQKELANGLADAGIPVLHLQPHRLADLFHCITLVGNIVGLPEAAAKLNNAVEREVNALRQKAESLPRRPHVYFEEWMDPLICGTGWVSDLIELAGGRDVFRKLSVNGKRAQERVISAGHVVDASPEIIFASWCGKRFVPEQLTGRPGYAEIPAVSNGQVFEADSLILQCGPALLKSAHELHERIHRYAAEDGSRR